MLDYYRINPAVALKKNIEGAWEVYVNYEFADFVRGMKMIEDGVEQAKLLIELEGNHGPA